MKVVVTGATGFVGKQLLPLMQEKGWDVAVLTRDAKSAADRLSIHCRRIEWSPVSGPPASEIFADADAVINLAGENIAGGLWTTARKQAILQSRVSVTRHLVESFRGLERKPGVFICASAIGIYGNRGSDLLDESSSSSNGFLAEVCQKWETEARRAEELGVRTVMPRIGIVLGLDGGAMQMMLPPFRLGLGGRLGSGDQWMSWIHVRDLARLIIHAVETPSLAGAVNAVSPHPIINKEFTESLASALKLPALLPVPGFVLKAALGDLAGLLLDSQRVSARKLQESGFKFTYPRITDALKVVVDHPGHELRTEQWVPQPVDRVFAFFADAKNLEALTPPYLHFKILSQSTEHLGAGTRIDYRMKLHGIPVSWQSTIGDWVPNIRFSDWQSRGPYAHWNHIHEFIEKDGGTIIRDRAVYRLPFWVPGDVFGHWLVRRDLRSIFAFRRKVIAERFGAEAISNPG